MDVPRNWVVLSGSTRITIEAAQIAMTSRDGGESVRSELSFAANYYYDDSTSAAALVNVRFYPDQALTQDILRTINEAEIALLDSVSLQATRSMLRGQNLRLVEWLGSRVILVGGLRAIRHEYRRSSGAHTFRVQLIRVLDSPRSFTLTASYREDVSRLLRPITEHVASSIRLRETPGRRP